jgi:hypothetical protein
MAVSFVVSALVTPDIHALPEHDRLAAGIIAADAVCSRREDGVLCAACELDQHVADAWALSSTAHAICVIFKTGPGIMGAIAAASLLRSLLQRRWHQSNSQSAGCRIKRLEVCSGHPGDVSYSQPSMWARLKDTGV